MTSSAPNLPTVTDITGGSTTESAFQQAMADLYAFLTQLVTGCTQEPLTIASGAITPTKAFFLVDPETGTTDDLTNIVETGVGAKLIIMKLATTGRTITLKHLAGGAGQLYMTGTADLAMINTTEMIAFSWNASSSRWEELWRNFGLSLPNSADVTAAKTALGMGTAAALATSAVFQVANNLSECTPATVRANLSLLGMALQSAAAVSISGGTISGITDLAVADGGSGRSSLATHGVLIGQGTSAVNVASPGTAGQVLTSNGPSADPTMQDASGAVVKIGEYNLSGLSSLEVDWTAQAYRKIEIVLEGINNTNTSNTGFYLRLMRNNVLYSGSYFTQLQQNDTVTSGGAGSVYSAVADQNSNSYWQFFPASTIGNKIYSGSIMLTGLYSTSLAPAMVGQIVAHAQTTNAIPDLFTFGGACGGLAEDITGFVLGRLTAGSFTNNSRLIVYGYK